MDWQPPEAAYVQVLQNYEPEDSSFESYFERHKKDLQKYRAELARQQEDREKIHSLEEYREKQDLLFEKHIERLDRARTMLLSSEQQQGALKDVMTTASSLASLSVSLLTLYHEYRDNHKMEYESERYPRPRKYKRLRNAQIHQIRELAKLRDEGYITSDEFELKKKEFLGLAEELKDEASRRGFWPRLFRLHDPPPKA